MRRGDFCRSNILQTLCTRNDESLVIILEIEQTHPVCIKLYAIVSVSPFTDTVTHIIGNLFALTARFGIPTAESLGFVFGFYGLQRKVLFESDRAFNLFIGIGVGIKNNFIFCRIEIGIETYISCLFEFSSRILLSVILASFGNFIPTRKDKTCFFNNGSVYRIALGNQCAAKIFTVVTEITYGINSNDNRRFVHRFGSVFFGCITDGYLVFACDFISDFIACNVAVNSSEKIAV